MDVLSEGDLTKLISSLANVDDVAARYAAGDIVRLIEDKVAIVRDEAWHAGWEAGRESED